MANRFANGAKSYGFCDRCGFRFDLKKLKNEVVKTKQTQIRSCPQCWSEDHPQLQLGMFPVSDPQAIRDPRPDTNTWYQSGTNGLQTSPTSGTGPLQEGYPGEGMLVIQWGWNPIGGARDFDAVLTPNTLIGVGEVGQVTATNLTTDPYFSMVKLLLHMDGISGSTTFVDNSPVGATISAFGNAQVDTSNVKFGTGSLLSDGDGDYLQPNTLINAVSTIPWTAELWVYSVAATPSIRWNSSSATRFSLGFSDGVTSADFLLFSVLGGNLTSTSYSITSNVWNFIAVVNDPATFSMKLYINGLQVASQTPKPLVDMARISAPSTFSFNGNIDDVRITVGVARYSGNFTPPTAPFPNY